MTASRLSAWGVRLLLAVLLFFSSEVWLWQDVLNHTPLDWVIRLVGYVALATLMLDFAVRYRIRNVYDAMALAAFYALLNALLITPQFTLTDFPQSILNRVLGGHALVGLEMFGLVLVLTRGDHPRFRRGLILAALALGSYWGILMRWMPELGMLFGEVNLSEVFSVMGVVWLIALIIYFVLRQTKVALQPTDLKLSLIELLVLLLVLIGLFLVQAVQKTIDLPQMGLIGLLALICWLELWFQHDEKGRMLFDDHFPITPLPILWIALAIVLFIGSMLLMYNTPLVGNEVYNQYWFAEVGFFVFGTLWIPTFTTAVATRAMDRQMRRQQFND